MSFLYNENISLKEVVKDLKKKIIELKNEISLKNKGYNLINSNLNVQNMDKISQIIIKNLMIESNKLKEKYSLMHNENVVLKKHISKLEKNLGIEEQMNYMRTLLIEKDQNLINLSHQIREYQTKVDDIILGNTEESKDKQIQILLNEVKSIRKRILNIITLNDRITNFDEFMEAIKIIKQLKSKNKDKNIDKAFDKLTELIEIYQQNNDNVQSKFIEEIYREGKNVFKEFNKEQNNYHDNKENSNDNDVGNN